MPTPHARPSTGPSASPRRAAIALAVAGIACLSIASPALAAPSGDFKTSFEVADPHEPAQSTVEYDADGAPIQENVRGTAPDAVMSTVTKVTASAENAPNEPASAVADSDPGTKWLAFSTAAWLQYDLSKPIAVSSYSLTSGNDAPERDPRNWKLLGSDDGATWTTLDTRTQQTWAAGDRGAKKTFSIDAPAAFSTYRLDVSANQSGGLIQLADWNLIGDPGTTPAVSPMTTEVGTGPASGYNMKRRMGFTGLRSMRYAGEHTAAGRGYATNRLLDVDVPVVETTRLSYDVFPELTQNDLQYPSLHVAVDLRFTDGTLLSDAEPFDAYETSATALGQGNGKILYPNQWNQVRIDVGGVAAGKTVDRILLSYDNDGASATTKFRGWIDDVKLEAKPATVDASSLTNFVDTRRGTNSSGAFSRGSNEAITAVPNGFNFLVPVTDARATSREYAYQAGNDDQNRTPFEGLGISHQPSPWMGDRNQFSVMPVPGAAAPSGNPDTRSARFSHDDETAQPDYYGVELADRTKAEMTPTSHGMIMRFRFPGDAGSAVLDAPYEDGDFTIDAATGAVSGWIDRASGYKAGQSRMFVSGTFDQKPTTVGAAAGGRRLTKFATFDTRKDKTVTLRLATSLISRDQAARNLALEVGEKSFEAVRAEARALWNDRLDVIEVEGASETQSKTLYGNLYRLNVYPNAQFENAGTDASPEYRYASPVSAGAGEDTATTTGAKVVDGKMYVNNGFWDTYRTAWPAYALLYPKVAAELIDGFTDQYREGGWIARWSSPGYANIMTGTSSDAAFADAYLRGVDLPDALATYDAAIKNASTPSADENVGRKSLTTSTFLGYTPASQGESVSWATEGYINDYGIANMAEALARDERTPTSRRAVLREESEYYRDRATSYVNLFDPAIDFFQARAADGTFSVPADKYDPTKWFGPYTETNGWGFAFHAPQDPQGLANLYGGDAGLEKKLDEFFATPETSQGPIHEEVEARDGRFGQWGVSNQVSHHIPFLYNEVGAPAKAQRITREALRRSFTGTEIGQGYPGDEDNGEMSAWHILSALGLYPMQVGSSELVVGSPLFTRATVDLGGRPLVINAAGNSSKNIYVQSLKVNGRTHSSTSIDSNLLSKGGRLDFRMGATPSKWGTRPKDGLPSLTEGDEIAKPLVDTTTPDIEASAEPAQDVKALFDNDSRSQVAFSSAHPSVTATYGGAKQRPTFYTLTSSATKADPSAWRLEGSDDGTSWTTVDARSGRAFANRAETVPFKVATPRAFSSFRLTVTAGDAKVALSELELLSDGTGAQAGALTFTPAVGRTATSGRSRSIALGVLSGGGKRGDATQEPRATVDWGDGSPAAAATFGAPRLGDSPVSAMHTFARPGVYEAAVTASVGRETVTSTVAVTVEYLEATGLRAAFDSTCISDEGVGADCDGGGVSYPRAGLEDGGLEQGIEKRVPGTDLRFTLPVVPSGAPDNATGSGQTIETELGAGATRLSFIGTGTEKDQDEKATVTFTDGSFATTTLQLSDWTRYGGTGATPAFGNIEVARATYRLSGGSRTGGSPLIFSTVPYEIPAGKRVASIGLPTQEGGAQVTGRVHVFAIASDGAAPPDQGFEVTAGDAVTARAGADVRPLLARIAEREAAAPDPGARVQWGDGTQTEDALVTGGADGLKVDGAHTYAKPGEYRVSVTVYNGAATKHVTLIASVS